MTADGQMPLRYVALGDSYTIGTSVDLSACWPAQLVEVLDRAAETAATLRLELVANLGVNGYTSGELISDELPELDRVRPEFASVLIGVNDVVRGIAATSYEANLRTTFEALQYWLWVERIAPVVADLLAGRQTRLATAPLELVQPLVRDPEMVCDLVVDGLGDGSRQGLGSWVGARQGTTEDGDLAGCWRGVG